GMWALPGGFVELDEDLDDAARRELKEETGLEPVAISQVGAWGTPGRDPRGRTVSAVYLGTTRAGSDQVEGADDAAAAGWHPVSSPPALAFDHDEILVACVEEMHRLCERTHLALSFLPDLLMPGELATVLKKLGVRHPEDAAARLISAAGVEQIQGEESGYRVVGDSFLQDLQEPVLMFPVGNKNR
ncbi:MAG: NUDIX hydrolase, partial [Planctomycetes bacterium]|nr:NUDIX hydrolase [Planctomycetota bacterium]